ncbi:MAG TPA: hypothetical protein VHA52_10080 [Candidatus Babeliaceae bacterium]|nr:hypothetical protein [Candidatus Babeliaceae bacterium]
MDNSAPEKKTEEDRGWLERNIQERIKTVLNDIYPLVKRHSGTASSMEYDLYVLFYKHASESSYFYEGIENDKKLLSGFLEIVFKALNKKQHEIDKNDQ